ncbi:Uncharacterised protein [Acinetobacter baumannii]|nr:Uncharacterised protein [Acinetobacter baumannii]
MTCSVFSATTSFTCVALVLTAFLARVVVLATASLASATSVFTVSATAEVFSAMSFETWLSLMLFPRIVYFLANITIRGISQFQQPDCQTIC